MYVCMSSFIPVHHADRRTTTTRCSGCARSSRSIWSIPCTGIACPPPCTRPSTAFTQSDSPGPGTRGTVAAASTSTDADANSDTSTKLCYREPSRSRAMMSSKRPLSLLLPLSMRGGDLIFSVLLLLIIRIIHHLENEKRTSTRCQICDVPSKSLEILLVHCHVV